MTGTHQQTQPSLREPHLALLHACMLLSGFGTVFLGPVLPALASNARSSDSGSGLFFTAQFLGAFVGGVTTSRRLWLSLGRGTAAATLGFLLLAWTTRLHAPALWDTAALLPLGFGVGQMLTSANLLASRRFRGERGSALSLINFSWSLGAVLAPFVLGTLLRTVALSPLLLCSALCFAVAFMGVVWNGTRSRMETPIPVEAQAAVASLPLPSFLFFGSLLLLYGGVETSLSGWITTFGTRYGSGAPRAGALGATALWIGITAGRALAPFLLRKLRERTLLLSSLAAATLLTATLSFAQGDAAIVLLAACLGLSLAPWFPMVLSGMLGEGAAAGQVGTIIAVSGIGAATLPLLLGTISRATGSLRIALLVPLCGLVLLFLLSAFRRGQHSTRSQESVRAGV